MQSGEGFARASSLLTTEQLKTVSSLLSLLFPRTTTIEAHFGGRSRRVDGEREVAMLTLGRPHLAWGVLARKESEDPEQ